MEKSILKPSLISRTRRNHSLEHATLHILGKKFPQVSLGGISSPGGFTIVGNVNTEDVAEAAIEGLKRLRSGDRELAIHANCGTNFAVTGALAGLAAWLGSLGTEKEFRKKLERLPLMIVLAVLTIIISRPLGPMVQRHLTTTSDPGTLELERVETSLRAGLQWHKVSTKG